MTPRLVKKSKKLSVKRLKKKASVKNKNLKKQQQRVAKTNAQPPQTKKIKNLIN